MRIGSEMACVTAVLSHVFRRRKIENHQDHTIKRSIDNAIKWKTCSPNSKIGDASLHAMTGVHILSSRPYVSQLPSSFISINES